MVSGLGSGRGPASGAGPGRWGSQYGRTPGQECSLPTVPGCPWHGEGAEITQVVVQSTPLSVCWGPPGAKHHLDWEGLGAG